MFDALIAQWEMDNNNVLTRAFSNFTDYLCLGSCFNNFTTFLNIILHFLMYISFQKCEIISNTFFIL